MIPEMIDIGGPWNLLPPGIHDCSLEELSNRFAYNERRTHLYEGLKMGVIELARVGCSELYVDGSFVTEKTLPGDFDACWNPLGVDGEAIDPVLLELDYPRVLQKEKYFGEFFPSTLGADGVHNFLEYFQIDRHTGKPKGIIRLKLSLLLDRVP